MTTKLEKLKAARDAAAHDAKVKCQAGYFIYAAARDAHEAELKRVQEEETDD